jgi:hypothetical protein
VRLDVPVYPEAIIPKMGDQMMKKKKVGQVRTYDASHPIVRTRPNRLGE